MLCSNCGAENPAGLKFCEQCATPFKSRCSQCGFENSPAARFCGECAAPLTPATTKSTIQPLSAPPVRAALEAAVADVADGARKTDTALVGDIKGWTELERDLDPEEARAIIAPALRIMIEAVGRYGGYIGQSTGGGVFSLFGAPVR